MKNITLIRTQKSNDGMAVHGFLTGEGKLAVTYEPLECIPEGLYKCRITYNKELGRVFEVLNVKDRSEIYLKQGNTIRDTVGSILVGTRRNDNGVLESSIAIGKLLQKLPNRFNLTILDLVKE